MGTEAAKLVNTGGPVPSFCTSHKSPAKDGAAGPPWASLNQWVSMGKKAACMGGLPVDTDDPYFYPAIRLGQ